jgi:hypothetical protein
MLLAHLLWQRTDRAERVGDDPTLVGDVLADALRSVTAEVTALFDLLPVAERKVLRAIAEYGTPLSSRALRDLDLPKSSAQSAAASLLDRALVERIVPGPDVDGRWRVVDPLTTRWIRSRYPTRPGP